MAFQLSGALLTLALVAGSTAPAALAAQNAPALPDPGLAPAQPAAPSQTTDRAAGYRIHLSDQLAVSFPFSADYNQTVAVQPDGTIALREAPPVQAQGATLEQLDQRIAEAYRGVLRDPKVYVTLTEFQRPSFYANGEVGRPGRFELRAHTTLIQALAEAGGITLETGERSQVIIFRPVSTGGYETTVVNVKKYAKARGEFEDFLVRPGDVIFVPQNTFSKIARFVPTPNVGAYAY